MRIYNIHSDSIWYFDIVYWRKLMKLIQNFINILKLYNSIISSLFSPSIRKAETTSLYKNTFFDLRH